MGDAEFWVTDEAPEFLNFSPESLGGATTRMALVAEDPDAVFERAIKKSGPYGIEVKIPTLVAKSVRLRVGQPAAWLIPSAITGKSANR